MRRKPRHPKESIFADGVGFHIIWVGIFLGIMTLAGYVWGQATLGLNPLDPTLGLQDMSAVELAELVGPEAIPVQWEEMSAPERVSYLLEEESSGAHEGGLDLLSLALVIPRTIAFSILALSQIAEVSAIHAGDASFFRVWFSRNRILFLAVILTFVLQLLVIYAPFLQDAFNTTALNAEQLVVSLVLASLVLFAVEIEKWFRRRRKAGRVPA